MTKNQSKPMVSLRDALYEFSLEKEIPDAELLEEYARRYPEHRGALTDFAIELTMDATTSEVEEPADAERLTVSPTVSRVMSRFQSRLFQARSSARSVVRHASAQAAPVTNPFAALDRNAFRNVVSGLQANSVFVAKLRDREIDVDTMSDGFRLRVAEEAEVPLVLVVAHFAAPVEIRPGQLYKSDAKPAATAKQSFEEAVKTSGLTEEQQRYLLSL